MGRSGAPMVATRDVGRDGFCTLFLPRIDAVWGLWPSAKASAAHVFEPDLAALGFGFDGVSNPRLGPHGGPYYLSTKS